MPRRSSVCALLVLLALVAAWPVTGRAQSTTTAPVMPKRLRIALVPLDDRPVCLQYPTMMAPLAHAEVVAPPIELLGRFTTPGDTDAIARWLRAQDWRTFDALIVSTDMLAYGGLVASRVHAVDADTALRRLDVLDEIRKAHATLPDLRLQRDHAPRADRRRRERGLAREARALGRDLRRSAHRRRAGRTRGPRVRDSRRRARRLPPRPGSQPCGEPRGRAASRLTARSTTSSCRKTMRSRAACTWRTARR